MSYQKKEWVTQEIIRGVDLNHLENGIYEESVKNEQQDEVLNTTYKTSDPSINALNDSDSIPLHDTFMQKKKITWSRIKDMLNVLFPPKNHAGTSTVYGIGNASQYGHVKLSDTYKSSAGSASQAVGASSKAVSDVYSTLSNQISSLESGLDWKESVATYSALFTTYPNPEDGWTVNVKDTNYTYRYDGLSWVAISANSIPDATTSVKGLMTTAYVSKLNGIQSGAQVNTVTGVKGNSETSYRTGDINITKANIGLGSVGNFKAVSTAASQGLTDAEKLNARTNIGAGTSSFSGSYNDLTNKPTITTVNNGTLTIQKNGTTVTTFTANQSGNSTANITISKSDVGLSNVGNFKAVSTVANQGLTEAEKANARTNIGAGSTSFSGDYNDLANKPTIGNATLTIQKNGATVKTFGANATANVTCNLTLSATDVGLGKVGNYKAVSTVANQGLTSNEKINARANIGAGTSSFSGSYNDLSNKPTIPKITVSGTKLIFS